MSIASLFARLGAPLANARWSWGAERPDGAVFLRAWQDLKFIDEERRIYTQIYTPRPDDSATPLGYQERRRHVSAVRRGAPCYLVMCVARDVNGLKRQIESFDDKDVFAGGEIVETEPDFDFPEKTSKRARFHARYGAAWIRLAGRRPAREFALI
jgi:hypothetical protein